MSFIFHNDEMYLSFLNRFSCPSLSNHHYLNTLEACKIALTTCLRFACVLAVTKDEIRTKHTVNAKSLSPDEGRRKYGTYTSKRSNDLV